MNSAVLGSNPVQVRAVQPHCLVWAVPWSLFINVRDCLLFYNSRNSLRLVLLVITCEYKQINFTSGFWYWIKARYSKFFDFVIHGFMVHVLL